MAREKTLPVDDVVRALTDVASALGHAHKRGVVHRDIKPQNVLVDDETGRCLLTDFGIARGDDSGPLTATGIVVGTPAYLAPERIMGEKSDHRADIYAVGVMAYELLAGRPPFHGATPMAGMMKRLEGPPQALHDIRRDVPQALEDVVNGCLAVDPADRFQSSGEIVRALTGATPSSGGQPTREGRISRTAVRKKRLPLIVGGVVVAAAAAWAAITMSAKGATSTPNDTRASIDTSMALIAGGAFTIGTDTGHPLARPAHVVRVSDFAIERHEVTIGEYKAFADSTGARLPIKDATADARLPVTKVLWEEAKSYCAWRYKPGGRLPTEEEWEVAARGSAGRAFPWGNTFDVSAANTASANQGRLTAVGSFARGATPEGVVDLIGNVWEWTSSALEHYPGGAALPDSMRQFRVIRGGAFNTPSAFATSWHRGWGPPATRPDDLEFTGFRCALTLPDTSAAPARD
jgi:formylglycine-generating enzyme required for sulfatase activity